MTKGPETSASTNTQRPSSQAPTLVIPWFPSLGLVRMFTENSAKLRKGEKEKGVAENRFPKIIYIGPRTSNDKGNETDRRITKVQSIVNRTGTRYDIGTRTSEHESRNERGLIER